MSQLCVENTGLQAEREENVLDPVITLGIEHVLLIVKGPGLSPSLSVSLWSILREEEEADWLSCHLTSLIFRHQCGPGQKRLHCSRYFAVCAVCIL